MNIPSRNINANDLNGVYDYFDEVINKLITTELDTDSYPVLTEFVSDLVELIDRLDELVADVNPRVEEYLANKQAEADLQHQLEEMRRKVEELQDQRRAKFGTAGVGQDPDNLSIWDADRNGVADTFGKGRAEIDFGTLDVDDLMTDDIDDIAFGPDEQEELDRRRQEAEQETNGFDEDDELLTQALDAISPADAFAGKLDMVKSGDNYDDLEVEQGLYTEDELNGTADDDDDGYTDIFAGGYLQGDDFRYEDDEDEDDEEGDPSDIGGYNDPFASQPFPVGDDFGDDDDEGQSDDDDLFGDDDWGDNDPLGDNIDNLLASGGMTI